MKSHLAAQELFVEFQKGIQTMKCFSSYNMQLILRDLVFFHSRSNCLNFRGVFWCTAFFDHRVPGPFTRSIFRLRARSSAPDMRIGLLACPDLGQRAAVPRSRFGASTIPMTMDRSLASVSKFYFLARQHACKGIF
jgi:hypothetical protein